MSPLNESRREIFEKASSSLGRDQYGYENNVALHLLPFFLYLPNTGIIVICHHAQEAYHHFELVH